MLMIFWSVIVNVVFASERPALWDSMMSCQEVQVIMESKRGRRRGDLYSGRCDPNVSFQDAPRPWDIVRLLNEQRPSLEVCVIRSSSPEHPYYSANFKILVRPPGTVGYSPRHTVTVVNSTDGEYPEEYFNRGRCIIKALANVEYPPARETYILTWHFATLPPDEDILNLDGILTMPEVERLEPEIEGAPPP